MEWKYPEQVHIRWLKIVLFVVALIPLLRLVWLGVSDNLGANPIEFIERSTGTWALICLLFALALTPVRILTGLTWPIQFRRMAGLFMFFYASLHFTIYIWLDHWFDWHEISKHIIEHPYVLVGFSAFMLAIPLAITSNQYMMRKLGRAWKKLHYSAYAIGILGVLHFLWLVKKDIREPLLYGCILALLLSIRLYVYLGKKLNKNSS